jgi:hypothetical protein
LYITNSNYDQPGFLQTHQNKQRKHTIQTYQCTALGTTAPSPRQGGCASMGSPIPKDRGLENKKHFEHIIDTKKIETTAKLARQAFNESANPFSVSPLCINQRCGLTFGQTWILSIY